MCTPTHTCTYSHMQAHIPEGKGAGEEEGVAGRERGMGGDGELAENMSFTIFLVQQTNTTKIFMTLSIKLTDHWNLLP